MNTGRFCYFTFFIIFHFIVGCNINTEIESAKGSKALPQYSVSDASVNEGSSANFNFDLETPATKDYIIKWEVQFVDSNSDDLVSLGGSVEIKKGDTGFVISIPTQDDNSFEADEEFNLIITEVNGKSTNELVAKGTIANDDPPPEVSFQLASQTVNESAGAVSALVRLNEISGLDVFIPYTLSGTADVNDHNQADGFFVILAGDIATGFIVTITDDTESEASEELIITMSTPTGGTATLGAQKVHTITISDNDTQVIITAPLETDTITSGNENSLSVSGTCSEAGQEVTISADDTNGGTSAVTPVVQPTCSGGNTFSTTINVSSLDDDTITITASHSNVGATSTGNDSVALTKNTVIPNPFLWTGGAHPDANWSTGANWQGGVAPSNTDIATFDGSCTNCNVTMDTNIDVAGINMQSGYTGTITQNAGVTVDVGASGWVQQAGIFQGSGGNINLNGTSTLAGGIFNSTSGILSINKQIDFTGITFNHNNGVVDLNATAPDEITGGGQTFNHLRIVATGGGGMSPFNGIFNVAGDMTINTNRHIESSAIFNIQKDLIINNIGYNLSITLRLVGSTSQNVISGMGEMRIPPIELASTGGIITFLDDQDFRGSVIYTSGTLDFGTTSTKLRASSTDTVHLPGIELYNLELTAFSGGIGAFTSDIIVKNNFVHSSAHQLDNNITFYVEGDVSIPGGTLVAQDSLYNVEFKGAGDQHFSFTGTKLTFGNF
ncbi:MAG: hypothetical protein KDD58_14970, partial [Bdellovibrionales bacterium]|nr:hypothetical protein [Bdellovibrionales bacterium]